MKDLKPLIIEITVGILLIGVSFFVKFDYYSTMIFSMGVGIITASVIQVMRIVYWKNPKRQELYEAKKRESYINSVDERKQLLRMKAGYITYQIMTLLLLALSFILAWMRAGAWIIGMIFLLLIFQCVMGVMIYRILQKKM